MTPQDIRQMCEITATKLAVAQSRMATLQKQDADLRQQLGALTKGALDPTQTPSPAQMAGADMRWQHWVDRRREDINAERARLRAKMDGARDALRMAFGKHQAMQQLAGKLRQQQSLQQSKRRS